MFLSFLRFAISTDSRTAQMDQIYTTRNVSSWWEMSVWPNDTFEVFLLSNHARNLLQWMHAQMVMEEKRRQPRESWWVNRNECVCSQNRFWWQIFGTFIFLHPKLSSFEGCCTNITFSLPQCVIKYSNWRSIVWKLHLKFLHHFLWK